MRCSLLSTFFDSGKRPDSCERDEYEIVSRLFSMGAFITGRWTTRRSHPEPAFLTAACTRPL